MCMEANNIDDEVLYTVIFFFNQTILASVTYLVIYSLIKKKGFCSVSVCCAPQNMTD